MEIQIEINGKKVTATVDDKALRAALAVVEHDDNCGYDGVNISKSYWYVDDAGYIINTVENESDDDNARYCNANYYTDDRIAEENARADCLMRDLRRFAARHHSLAAPCSTKNNKQHWSIGCCSNDNELGVIASNDPQQVGEVCFWDEATARDALDTFKDELIWYYTKYLPTLW